IVQLFVFSKTTGAAPTLLPAKTLPALEDPLTETTGTVGEGGSSRGDWPIGIRMLERKRLPAIVAVAGPARCSSTGWRLSKTECSIATPPPEPAAKSMPGSEVSDSLPRL